MAIFDMEHIKSPGPDGFLVEFYQFFWEIVKSDLMSLFLEFHSGRLLIHNLNFGTLTLLPKVSDVVQIQQYRPICLSTASFKIFTEVLNNGLLKVVDKLIGPSKLEIPLRCTTVRKNKNIFMKNVRIVIKHKNIAMKFLTVHLASGKIKIPSGLA